MSRAVIGPGILLAVVVALSALRPPSGARAVGDAPRLNLFQLIARSEVVVHVKVREGATKHAHVDVVEAIKGEPPADVLRIAFREFNFSRGPGVDPIVFPDRQEEILFLIAPETARKKEKNRDILALYRGEEGRITLPAEGRGALLEAIRALAALSARPPQSQVAGLQDLLGSPNRVLTEAVLDEILRLRASSPTLYLKLVGLLSDPAPGIRIRSLQAIRQIFTMKHASVVDERPDQARSALAAVIERARNDDVIGVRVEAVSAMAAWPERGSVEGELRAIARQDPSQDVRYEAERALFKGRIPPT